MAKLSAELSPQQLRTARTAEAVEAAATADAYAACSDGELGAATVRIGDATLTRVANLPSGFFSRVIGLGMEQPANTARVEEILEWYRQAGVRDLWFQPSPAAEPDGLIELLAQRSIRPIARRWGKFVRGTEPPPEFETELDIVEVTSADREAFASAAMEGFGLPALLRPMMTGLPGRAKWRTYVAYDGAVPAACGAVFIHEGAAWVGFGATRPDYRRRGAQRALLARRVKDAIEAGCETLCTETGVDEAGPGPSWRNISSAGFSLLYLRPNCAPTASE